MRILRSRAINSILLSLWLVGGPLLGSALLSWAAYLQVENPIQLCGWDVLWVFLGLSVSMGFALLPTTAVCLVGGYLAGFWSLLFTLPSYMLAIGVGYVLGRATQPAWLLAYLQTKPKLAMAVANLQTGTWQTVFWLRLSPVLPFGIGNVVLAWGDFSLRSVILGSLLGMLPRAVLATWIGMLAKSLQYALAGEGRPAWAFWVLGIAALLAAFMLWRQLRQKGS